MNLIDSYTFYIGLKFTREIYRAKLRSNNVFFIIKYTK